MPGAKRTSSPCELEEGETCSKRSRHSSKGARNSSSASEASNSSINEGDVSSEASNISISQYISENEGKLAGCIEKVYMKNFMCHSALEVTLNRRINFIVGRNGSGKSAILAAVVIALGCKASITNRASSLKDFIKNGANSAMVQVTLCNEGLYAYKPEIYGPKITVIRYIYIGSTPSSYKFKSSKGEIISTKREELEKIITAFNIQVDNPISVLNQDTARTFLACTDPKAKYALFMKATKLEEVDQLHAKTLSCEAQISSRLKLRKECTHNQKADIEELEKKAFALKKLEEIRKKAVHLENEYFWALARDEEKLLEGLEEKIDKEKESIKPIQVSLAKHKGNLETKLSSLRDSTTKLEEINNAVKETQIKLNKANDEYKQVHLSYRNSLQKYKQLAQEEKKYKSDMQAVRQEIEKHKGGQENVVERRKLTDAIEQCKVKVSKLHAIQQTTEMEYQNLRGESEHFFEQGMELQGEKKSADQTIKSKKYQLEKLRSESDNLTIYGEGMPKLVRRIEECYNQRKFVRKPLGPLGSLLKVEDPQWARTIEMEIGNVCRYFACHCASDSKLLQHLFKEVGMKNPGITVSRFTDRLHNIRDTCVRAPGYRNIFDVVRISDVNAANALIDTCSVEGILLIPTGEEAAKMMSRNVPKNCKKGITLVGDQYFPYPDYRMYAGNRKSRATLLQVSKQDIIRQLENELDTEKRNCMAIDARIQELNDNINGNKERLKEIEKRLRDLRTSKSNINALISEYESAMDLLPDPQHFLTLNSELESLQQKIEIVMKKFEEANKESDGLKELSNCAMQASREIQAEINRLDEERQKSQLEFTNQKEMVRKTESKVKNHETAYTEHCSNVNKMLELLKKHQKQTEEVSNHARKMCPQRIQTTRPAIAIHQEITDCKSYQSTVEDNNGATEEIIKLINEKKTKYRSNMDEMKGIDIGLKALAEALETRKQLYKRIARVMELKVAYMFKPLLSARGYKGNMLFNGAARTLDVEIAPNQENETRGTKSLSGGERSYSTVSFILSLWECIEPPFYFMDEFDVFMDKVNRRIVINMLLTYAHQKKRHQYVFLTPQDTTQITTSEDVTIYRLDDPETTTTNEFS